MTVARPSKYFTNTLKKILHPLLKLCGMRSLRDSHLCVFSGALLQFVRKTPLCCTVASTGSMTVAHPSKYFTSTPKKLIQLELMPLVLWSLRDSQTCDFSGVLLQSEGENVIWLQYSFINRQYDRGSPIKILHKYPKEAYST